MVISVITEITNITDHGFDARVLILPMTGLSLTVFAVVDLPPWASMWLLAATLFFACKWATWWPYRNVVSARRSAAFLMLHPGMDATSFLFGPNVAPPPAVEWMLTGAKTAAGVALLWLLPRAVPPFHPLMASWLGMIGLALCLHFGVLHATTLLWRANGIDAELLMRRPARSRSLADFWGRRWNTGFRHLTHEFVFRPLTPRIGATSATAVTFLASGVIHDLVISLPARGGFGLPTLYFLIQFVGLLIERTRPLRGAFSRHPIIGRVYTAVFTIAPLPMLFHPPFIHRVFLPFLRAVGALP
jgi:alginate O-acetyltransferase complex protein AlgI